MKLPSKVRITSKVSYEVVYSDSLKDDTLHGECRLTEKQIVLSNNQSNTELVKTFIHEVLHAVAEENVVPLTENQVRGLEEGLYRLLRLNKWIHHGSKKRT